MNLTQLREAVAAALDGVSDEWTVHPTLVDAAQPPAFMVTWVEPWLAPASFCESYAELDVIAVAGRLAPDEQYETLEAMVAGVYNALATVDLAPRGTSAPYPMELAQVTYLAARVHVRQPVELVTTVQPVTATGRFG